MPMDQVRLSRAITKAELHRRFRAWLATGEQKISPSGVDDRTAWVHVRDGELRFVLYADTNRPAVEEYLGLVGVHGDDIEWRVVESRGGKLDAVAFGPDAAPLVNALCLYPVRRKGWADPARKTVGSGYLIRKLTDVAQNVVITMHDCGTTMGISKGIIYNGDEIDRPLSDAIRGRVSRETIAFPTTGALLLEENEMITPGKAKELENLGIDRIRVRSPMTCVAPMGPENLGSDRSRVWNPMTCEGPLSVCRLCYGMDTATGALVEAGAAVGISAVRSIGSASKQLTVNTSDIGGALQSRGNVVTNEHKAKKGGLVRFERITVVTNEHGQRIALSPRGGEVHLLHGKDGPVVERFGVPHGAEVLVAEGQDAPAGTALVKWDPHSVPIIAEEGGVVRYKDLEEGVTVQKELDKATGVERFTIMELTGDLHPQIMIEGENGRESKIYYIHERANLRVTNGQKVFAGTLLAETPREVLQPPDPTGGLTRVVELFEARHPPIPAVMAEVAGRVRIDPTFKRGKRIIEVIEETEDGKSEGEVRAHQVPAGARLRVHPGEYVQAGDPLVHGTPVPHDILRIRGEWAVQEYLVREVQSVYRAQRVDLDDKHIEIIVDRMLRTAKVFRPGDTGLLPRAVLDRFVLVEVNRRLTEECVKVEDPGDTTLVAGRVYSKEEYAGELALGQGERKPTWMVPEPASWAVQLLGITAAAAPLCGSD
jgi:DNA-directed RNA polymerase subunit beta'